MSWGITVSGKPAAASAKAVEQLNAIIDKKYVVDPDELKQVAAVRDLIVVTLAAYTENNAVMINANGSCSIFTDKKHYSVSLDLKPVWNWVE